MVLVDNTKHTSGAKFRLKVMLGLVPLCFLTRAVIMTYGITTMLSLSYWWFDIVYFTSLEVLPLLLVLRISLRLIQAISFILQSNNVNSTTDSFLNYKSIASNSSY